MLLQPKLSSKKSTKFPQKRIFCLPAFPPSLILSFFSTIIFHYYDSRCLRWKCTWVRRVRQTYSAKETATERNKKFLKLLGKYLKSWILYTTTIIRIIYCLTLFYISVSVLLNPHISILLLNHPLAFYSDNRRSNLLPFSESFYKNPCRISFNFTRVFLNTKKWKKRK